MQFMGHLTSYHLEKLFLNEGFLEDRLHLQALQIILLHENSEACTLLESEAILETLT